MRYHSEIQFKTPAIKWRRSGLLTCMWLRRKARQLLAMIDFEDGIIKPDEVKFMGRFIPFKKRTVGCKVRMLIRGRELKRVYSEGRQVNRFALDLERLAS